MRTDTREFCDEVLADLDRILSQPLAILSASEIAFLSEGNLSRLADRMARMGKLCRRCGREYGMHSAKGEECPMPEGGSRMQWAPGQSYSPAEDETDGERLKRRLGELGCYRNSERRGQDYDRDRKDD